MARKHIKVDKINKLKEEIKKKKSPPFGILHVSHYGTLPSSTWFCRYALQMPLYSAF